MNYFERMQFADNKLDAEILSVIESTNSAANLLNDKSNLQNDDLINILGMSIYRLFHSIFLYNNFNNISSHKIAHIIESNYSSIIKNIHTHLINIADESQYTLLCNIPKLLVVMCHNLGIPSAYDNLERFFRIEYKDFIDENDCRKDIIILNNRDKSFHIAESLNITEDVFYIKQLEESTTYRFCKNSEGTIKSNESLHITGVYALNYLANDYLLNKFSILDTNTLFQLKGKLLSIDELYKKLPKELYLNVNIDKYPLIMDLRKKFNNRKYSLLFPCMSVFTFKCIIASIFINYIEYKDKAIFDVCKHLFTSYVNKGFDCSNENTDIYRNFMYYFAETNHINFHEYEQVLFKQNYWCLKVFNDSSSSIVNIRFHEDDYNVIYKNALSQLLDKWKNNWLLKEELAAYLNIEINTIYKPIGIFSILDTKKIKQNNYNQTSNIVSHEQSSPQKNPSPNVAIKKAKSINKIKPQDKINFDGSLHTLYIMRKEPKCLHKHNVISVTGILTKLSGAPVRINVNYCENCKRFYIHKIDFDRYCDRYGIILGSISLDYMGFPKQQGQFNLAAESPLHFCGYTVNQQDNYTESERHKILASIMNHGIMKKPEIINYLHFYINTQGSNKRKALAVSKWEDDLDFVTNYRLDKQRRYKISNIK